MQERFPKIYEGILEQDRWARSEARELIEARRRS
jgi:hypothetical protein